MRVIGRARIGWSYIYSTRAQVGCFVKGEVRQKSTIRNRSDIIQFNLVSNRVHHMDIVEAIIHRRTNIHTSP